MGGVRVRSKRFRGPLFHALSMTGVATLRYRKCLKPASENIDIVGVLGFSHWALSQSGKRAIEI